MLQNHCYQRYIKFYKLIGPANTTERTMEEAIIMEIKDNTFARQFETTVLEGLISVEYSFQEKKIFLTKINTPESFTDEEFINDLLKNIMNIAYERKLKVVPILPKIALFFRKNTIYRDLLPPGIKI